MKISLPLLCNKNVSDHFLKNSCSLLKVYFPVDICTKFLLVLRRVMYLCLSIEEQIEDSGGSQ